MKIILGTAHSKSTPGKKSPDDSIREWSYSRELCKSIQAELVLRGYDCMIDVEGDEEYSLQNRCNIVNRYCRQYGAKNCIYVSIHLNAAGRGEWCDARGLSVYVSPNSSQNSKDLAKILYEEGALRGLRGNRSVPFCKYWVANYYVLRNTKCPAVLTENLFQDNKLDVAFLLSESGKKAIVDYHVYGIIKYIKSRT